MLPLLTYVDSFIVFIWQNITSITIFFKKLSAKTMKWCSLFHYHNTTRLVLDWISIVESLGYISIVESLAGSQKAKRCKIITHWGLRGERESDSRTKRIREWVACVSILLPCLSFGILRLFFSLNERYELI